MKPILIHPIGMDTKCWDFLTIDEYEAFDLIGHGTRVSEGAGQLTMEKLADDLLSQFSGRRDLVGIAFGGAVAQHLAIRHPERVSSLLLINTTSRASYEVMEKRAKEAIDQGLSGILDETFDRWFTQEALKDSSHEGINYARNRFLKNDVKTYSACWSAMANHNAHDSLDKLTMPVTIVGSTGDKSATIDKVKILRDQFQNKKYIEIDGPHMNHLENPQRISQVIESHLNQLSNGLDAS
jgi:pimeloyl-ACP methyl ester carboxylesterase